MSKVYLQDTTLTSIGDAIREKKGESTTYLPSEMPAAIQSISGGGEPVIESKTITANGTYTAPEGVDGYSPVVVNVATEFPAIEFFNDISDLDYKGLWDVIFRNFPDKLTTRDIQNASRAFSSSKLEDLSSFTINVPNNSPMLMLSGLCSYCYYLKKPPKLNLNRALFTRDSVPIDSLFEGCRMLREIPSDWADNLPIEKSGDKDNIFNDCFSLREMPQRWLSTFGGDSPSKYSSFYYYLAYNTYSLNELLNLRPYTWLDSSNLFADTFSGSYRLKNFTFLTNNGTPQTVNWKNQTINLTRYIGYAQTKSMILDYNSGITADKEVTDAASYASLKNDPDWFTSDIAYSRYNHDSAVATINSLPDTKAYIAKYGGTNTIKFKGAAGSATDGGAINTLTHAEIAVATNKGWTVTLV